MTWGDGVERPGRSLREPIRSGNVYSSAARHLRAPRRGTAPADDESTRTPTMSRARCHDISPRLPLLLHRPRPAPRGYPASGRPGRRVSRHRAQGTGPPARRAYASRGVSRRRRGPGPSAPGRAPLAGRRARPIRGDRGIRVSYGHQHRCRRRTDRRAPARARPGWAGAVVATRVTKGPGAPRTSGRDRGTARGGRARLRERARPGACPAGGRCASRARHPRSLHLALLRKHRPCLKS